MGESEDRTARSDDAGPPPDGAGPAPDDTGPPPDDAKPPRGKLRWAALTLGLAVVGSFGWAAMNHQLPWSGLPDRVCWDSVDSSLLASAAAADPGDADWEVTEEKDTWEDPSCTVERGDWRAGATVMKAPLGTRLWWNLGGHPLPGNLPGMVTVRGDRVDGWLHLPQCRDRVVNVDVPGARRDRTAAADLAARMLVAVGNSRVDGCGGEPFPEPRAFGRQALEPVALGAGEAPCGLPVGESLAERGVGDLQQWGSLAGGTISRCRLTHRSDKENDLGALSALVLRDKGILDAFSPTGVRTTVQVTPGRPPKLSPHDLRYDRDGATALACARGNDTRYVHVFASGPDPHYAAMKRAVLNEVAARMSCR
ncbi:hypothetical protein ACQPZG_00945 (plasmid) [Streptomyces sp. CA-294286]|uniref:hypothetical protein n=1 Tax=Streptomyces sp. CA-294286 TaxID=3240070 RepID=UPI003D8DB34F